MTLLYIITAVLCDGLAGLAGGFMPPQFVHKNMGSLLAFAAGTLIGVAFLDLIPEALHSSVPVLHVTLACLSGFFVFYLIESVLGSHAAGQSGHKHDTIGPLLLVGDALHNATDGVAIAAAFLNDFRTGVATTLAVIVHELPQEISDYSILLSHGYSRMKALLSLGLVQLTAVFGAIATYFFAEMVQNAAPYLMGLSAGGFLYIAAADLLPQLHRHTGHNSKLSKIICFGTGVGLIAVLQIFLHH